MGVRCTLKSFVNRWPDAMSGHEIAPDTVANAPNAPIKSKLQHPPRAFDYFLCPGVGNLTDKAFPGVGNLTLPGGVGKIEPEVSGFKSLFFLGGGGGVTEVANSYKHVFGRDGRVKGRDTALQKKSLQKKVLKSESA